MFSDVNWRGEGGNAELRGDSVNQDNVGSDYSLDDGRIGPSRSGLKNHQHSLRNVMRRKYKLKRSPIALTSNWWMSASETEGTMVAVANGRVAGTMRVNPDCCKWTLMPTAIDHHSSYIWTFDAMLGSMVDIWKWIRFNITEKKIMQEWRYLGQEPETTNEFTFLLIGRMQHLLWNRWVYIFVRITCYVFRKKSHAVNYFGASLTVMDFHSWLFMENKTQTSIVQYEW